MDVWKVFRYLKKGIFVYLDFNFYGNYLVLKRPLKYVLEYQYVTFEVQ